MYSLIFIINCENNKSLNHVTENLSDEAQRERLFLLLTQLEAMLKCRA
jgi:hypothetical protein